jgi:hypothetical protein
MNTKDTGGSAFPLAVFSGDCLAGVCGEAVGFNDMAGEPLHVGDIVQTFTVIDRKDGDCEWLDMMGDKLTVVVSDEWESFSDGSLVRKPDHDGFYVMGIKSIPMDEPGNWRVRLVKSHKDVIEGERWPAYGFNYRPVPLAARKEES